MSRGRGGGLGRKLLSGLGWLVVIAVVVAIFRAFNYDPFGVFDWAFSWAKEIVMNIADWLSGNRTFQKFTTPQ